jgi:hypothetical protein
MDTNGTKTYQIDKHKQLIPLNGSTVNFSCIFEVKSKDNKPFNIAIVEQGEIKPKQYKLVDNGYINGQLESDGQLKTYFLVLKAQQPCECEVRVVVKPKQGSEPLSQQPMPGPSQQPSDPNVIVVAKPETFFQMKYIIGLSIALIIIYLAYKYRKAIFGKLTTKDMLAPSMSSASF